jgi:hypothetical protein
LVPEPTPPDTDFVVLKSQDGGECFVFLDSGADGTCSIMHEDIETVCLDDLSPQWTLHGASYRGASLECQHRFHVAALAMHFVRDMRCPVCRDGPGGALDLDSLPDAVQAEFAPKALAAAAPEVLENFVVDTTAIESDWVLVATIFHPHLERECSQATIIPTRILPQTELDGITTYALQAQFNRHLHTALARHGTNASVHCRFMLYHPCLPENAVSPLIPITTLAAFLQSGTAPLFDVLHISVHGLRLATFHCELSAAGLSRLVIQMERDRMLQVLMSAINDNLQRQVNAPHLLISLH